MKRGALLVSALVALGCAGPKLAGAPKPKATTAAVASASPAPLAVLKKPTTASTAFSGRVALDPLYAVSKGAGSLQGGVLIANNGSSLIANNGGNVIANNGGGVIANHGAGYRLADVAPGAQVPAAGMRVGVRSLRDGTPLALGVDAAGQPVYAVYSDARGEFTVYLPPDVGSNVLVQAVVPQHDDAHLRYDVVSVPADAQVDEDTALATRYLREVAIRRLVDFCEQDPSVTEAALGDTHALPDGVKPIASAAFERIHAAATSAGITGAAAQQPADWAIVAGIVDALIADYDLSQIKLTHDVTPYWGLCAGQGPEPALPALVDVFRQLREGAAAKLAADPRFFEGQAYYQRAVSCKPGAYPIARATDFLSFFVDEFLAPNRYDAFNTEDEAMTSVGVQSANGVNQQVRLGAGVTAVSFTLVVAILTNQDGALDMILDRLAKARPNDPLPTGTALPTPGLPICPIPTKPPTPTPDPNATPPSPCPPYVPQTASPAASGG